MSSEGSVTDWIGRLQAGDQTAAQPLWERYFRRLVGLARRQLQGALRGSADEEDVALSAFASFCRAALEGRFPRLADRDDLWRLLFALTLRKAHDLVRDQCRQKRGGSALLGPPHNPEEASPEKVLDREPTPEFAAQVAEECQRLLCRLDDAELRSVALWKMEGYTNEEIAQKLGRSDRTVERKLRLIRKAWEEEAPP
jgi:DNA-directed RNA polymerase specialized sigma24 family protein